MSDLSAWVAERGRSAGRVPVLEEALLGGRFAAYAAYRLRGFALVRLAAAAVHVIEYALVARFVSLPRLLGYLVVSNVCQLVAAAWWGALEVLRARLRAERAKNRRQLELDRWLGRAAVLAVAILAATGVGLAARHRFRAGDAFVAACALRLAVDVVARTLYSGVYATRRIYRPLLSLVAAELVALAIVAATAGLLGAWSVAAGLVVALAVSRGLMIVYTLRAYRLARQPLPSLRLRGPRAPRAPLGVLLAAAANVAARLPPAATLLLLAAGARRTGVTLHLVGPLLVAASLWPQVFYLDAARLAPEAAVLLRRRLERRLVAIAPLAGAALYAVALGAAAAAGAAPAPGLALALAPIFLAQALLAALQLVSFVAGRFAAMAASGVALVAALLLVGPIGGLVAGVVVLHLVARLAARPPPAAHDSLFAWLRALAAVPGPVSVVDATLERAATRQARAFADAVAARGAVVCAASRGRVLWFGAGEPPTALAALGGGLVGALRQRDAATGRAAVAAMAPDGPPPPDPARAFRERFPDGQVIDVVRGRAPALPPGALAGAWREAASVWAPRGPIELLFLLPQAAPAEARRAWRELLEQAHWHAALDPPY